MKSIITVSVCAIVGSIGPVAFFHKYAVHIDVLVIQRKTGTDLAVEFSYLCLCTGASSCFCDHGTVDRVYRHVKELTVLTFQCGCDTGHIADIIACISQVIDTQIKDNGDRFGTFCFVDLFYKLCISCIPEPAQALSWVCNKRNPICYRTAHLFVQCRLYSCSTGISHKNNLTVHHTDRRMSHLIGADILLQCTVKYCRIQIGVFVDPQKFAGFIIRICGRTGPSGLRPTHKRITCRIGYRWELKVTALSKCYCLPYGSVCLAEIYFY